MKPSRFALAFHSLAAVVFVVPTVAVAAPEIGRQAPAFSGQTDSGETISLDQFRGRKVVLEWTNDGCPFVQKHYETGNMQATQQAVTEDGTVWISVISSAEDKQGYSDAARSRMLTESRSASPSHVVLDASGDNGRAYLAKTTPQMFVIDEAGILRYMGAIDNKPSAKHATVDDATNYVLAAMSDLEAGREVAVDRTKPYGCSVKYGS